MSKPLSKNDPTSYSNTEDFHITNTVFDWNLDFNQSCISGFVDHTVICKNMKAKEMYLDANKLEITKVFIEKNEAKFSCSVDNSLWGKLTVKIANPNEKFQLKIHYQTTSNCSALQWMEPELTLGRRKPYVYSQCQAIHARSLFPCQDTPGNKATYSATVSAPKGIEVLMSAVKENSNKSTDSDIVVHKFIQKIPISSYLVAIAAGDIVGKNIGPRSKIWCEPELINDASWEFQNMNQLLVAAEKLCGPYEWGVYDMLILPPTFPYGGMENPCLTFVTPCLIGGDRSQVNVVAHEIAHSWTGNLVTNSNWDHFWINEGHTNYLERLILESVEGTEEYRHLHISTGMAELKESMDNFNDIYGKNHEFCKLIPHLVGLDPDDAFSRVPYEKGSLLLFYLESLVGKDNMMKWLKEYIKKFRLKSLNSEEWKAFFFEFMKKHGVAQSTLDSVDWNSWFYGTEEIPINMDSKLNRKLLEAAEHLADNWIELSTGDIINNNQKDKLLTQYESLKLIDQRCHFLRILYNIKCVKLPHHCLDLMNELYHLSSSRNTEILYGWSMLCLLAQYEPGVETIFQFVNSNGRLMYNKPIYKHLSRWPKMRDRTHENFQLRQHMIHPLTRSEIKKILESKENL